MLPVLPKVSVLAILYRFDESSVGMEPLTVRVVLRVALVKQSLVTLHCRDHKKDPYWFRVLLL